MAQKTTPAQMLNGIVKQRQGGSTGDANWYTAGSSNTDTSAKAVKIQVGSVTSPSNTTKTITFPEAFTQVPLVFALVQSAFVNNQVRVYIRDATTTQFVMGNLDVGTEVCAWMAIGQ